MDKQAVYGLAVGMALGAGVLLALQKTGYIAAPTREGNNFTNAMALPTREGNNFTNAIALPACRSAIPADMARNANEPVAYYDYGLL